MKLADLPLEHARFDPRFAGLELAGVAADSRKVKPGDLFVAVPGTKSDGLAFVPQALAAGAVAVMAERAAGTAGGHRLHRGAGCAPRAGALRRRLLSAPAGNHRRRHRHQRQDLGRRLHAPDLGGARSSRPPASAPSVWCRRKGETYGSLTTPDPIELHRTLDQAGGRGRHPSRARSLVARSRAAPPRRRAHRRRRLHQSVARPSRLSPDHGSLSRRQAAAVRYAHSSTAAPRWSASTIATAARWSMPPRSAA